MVSLQEISARPRSADISWKCLMVDIGCMIYLAIPLQIGLEHLVHLQRLVHFNLAHFIVSVFVVKLIKRISQLIYTCKSNIYFVLISISFRSPKDIFFVSQNEIQPHHTCLDFGSRSPCSSSKSHS
jgi:hypothetical protein